MLRSVTAPFGAILLLVLGGSTAICADNLTDAQSAHFLATAAQADIDAANLALTRSSNSLVRTFANDTAQNHAALAQRNRSLLRSSSMTPEDNDYSTSLAGAALMRRQELSKLTGLAFDKAYVKNELFYDLLVVGVLDARLIPAAKNSELKSMLASSLAVFKERQINVRSLVRAIK